MRDERVTPTVRLTFAAAFDEAVAHEMRVDDRVFIMGTDPPAAIAKEFGAERARRMPVSEALFTGMAVGAAAFGLRPVVYWRNATFSFVAFDQLVNQAAKLRYMTGGQRAFPITFLCYGGAGMRMAAQHAQSPYAMYAQVPGLKVVAPTTPADAYGTVVSAIRDDNPTICFGASRLDSVEGEVPREGHVVPLGTAHVRRSGDAVTIVAVAGSVPLAEEAAARAAASGVAGEVIDLVCLAPIDAGTVRESVRRTGRLVVVDEAPARCSVASEVIATVTEDHDTFRALTAPPVRVCGMDAPIPFSPILEDEVVPSVARIEHAIRRIAGR